MAMNDDDITLDSGDVDDSVVAEEHQGDAIKKLKEKLKEAESKAKEHLDNWQRAQAEFVNVRKRDEGAKQDFLKFSNARLIAEFIPVLDSCNSAVEHGHKDVEPIRNQLLKILKQNGVEELDPVGETFDPAKHEALGMVKTDKESDDHKILDVLQKGYIMGGKVIRPAKVRVGEFTS